MSAEPQRSAQDLQGPQCDNSLVNLAGSTSESLDYDIVWTKTNYAPSTTDISVTVSDNEEQPLITTAKRVSPVVFVYIVIFVGLSVVNSVSRKLMVDSYGTKYVFFRQQLTNLLYNCYATAVVVYKLLCTDSITPTMRRYPIWKFMALGALDGFADFLGSVGGVQTPGQLQVLINQLVIPVTMVIAFVAIGTRYRRGEIGGCVVILVGLVTAVLPTLTHERNNVHVRWYSVLIYISAIIPQSASAVYKDVAFKQAALDVFWLTTLVSWSQLFITWVFVPIESFHSFGGVPLRDIPSVFHDGALCFLGDSSIPTYNEATVTGHCSAFTPRVTLIYSVTGFLGGIFQLLVVKDGSAVLMVVSQALSLPLSNIAFSVAAFTGAAQVERFSFWDLGGLVLVLIGFLCYSSKHFVKRSS